MDRWKSDDWQQRCRDNFSTTACALWPLAAADTWPLGRWGEALQAWSQDTLTKRSWRYLAPVLARMPDEQVESLAHDISRWLQAVGKILMGHDALFFDMCRRVLALPYPADEDTTHPVERAINHPVGLVTQALLDWWSRRPLDDGQGLPDELHTLFAALCDTTVDKFCHARVLLAAHAITLFRVDREWATQHLLPLFDWQGALAEAPAIWQGFLWTARLDYPLLAMLKAPFLDTARRYAELDGFAEQYAVLLTVAALDQHDTFTPPELARATQALPEQGLRRAVHVLEEELEVAGDQRADYWLNRVDRYLHAIWPKSRQHLTPDTWHRGKPRPFMYCSRRGISTGIGSIAGLVAGVK